MTVRAPETAALARVPDLHAHAEMLRRYLFVLGARADRIEDLLQEVFAVALKKELNDQGAAPVAVFLRRAAKNMVLRDRHSQVARREVELADEVWREECVDEDEELRLDALRQCVAALADRSRALLQRVYVDGAGRRDVGKEFGLVPNGVKTAMRRLRAGLRECVARRLGDES